MTTETGGEPRHKKNVDRRTLVAAAVAAVVGLVVGGVIVALTGLGDSSSTDLASRDGSSSAGSGLTTTPSPALTPSPTPSPALSPGGAAVAVDARCIEAIRQAQTVYDQLQQAVAAARDLDASALDAVVNQLRDLQPSLQDNLQACEATVTLPSGGVLSPEPSPLQPTVAPSAG